MAKCPHKKDYSSVRGCYAAGLQCPKNSDGNCNIIPKRKTHMKKSLDRIALDCACEQLAGRTLCSDCYCVDFCEALPKNVHKCKTVIVKYFLKQAKAKGRRGIDSRDKV